MPTEEKFIPRLNDNGINGNPYWYGSNPFYVAGYGLPNCTCYAWGRFWEEAGRDYRPNLSTGNANDWYNYNDGYSRGNKPALGAVLCLYGGIYSGDGHVAVVEQINADGSIETSESAYGGSYWNLVHREPPDYVPFGGYSFQGFIYNPHSGGSPTGIGKNIWYYKRKLWRIEKEDF